jgi:hypothetical protein
VIILSNALLCLELNVKDKQKGKVENIIIILTWELDRDRQVKTRHGQCKPHEIVTIARVHTDHIHQQINLNVRTWEELREKSIMSTQAIIA